MNIGQFHESLASEHPSCIGIHWDHKKHITISDLSELHDAGFKDCSWGNDECPSYYIPDADDTHLYAYYDDAIIEYSISHNSRPCMGTYTDITDAIREYKRIIK